ncbi:unnamed protein product [Allacma fusca]|uniref:Uncharacterized protein n=1 Tax=Allacma fusca TaxID=39272 RepID=A0A8J2PHT7_9HEXA|nr:unnamed protein product [Allacma fusca]
MVHRNKFSYLLLSLVFINELHFISTLPVLRHSTGFSINPHKTARSLHGVGDTVTSNVTNTHRISSTTPASINVVAIFDDGGNSSVGRPAASANDSQGSVNQDEVVGNDGRNVNVTSSASSPVVSSSSGSPVIVQGETVTTTETARSTNNYDTSTRTSAAETNPIAKTSEAVDEQTTPLPSDSVNHEAISSTLTPVETIVVSKSSERTIEDVTEQTTLSSTTQIVYPDITARTSTFAPDPSSIAEVVNVGEVISTTTERINFEGNEIIIVRIPDDISSDNSDPPVKLVEETIVVTGDSIHNGTEAVATTPVTDSINSGISLGDNFTLPGESVTNSTVTFGTAVIDPAVVSTSVSRSPNGTGEDPPLIQQSITPSVGIIGDVPPVGDWSTSAVPQITTTEVSIGSTTFEPIVAYSTAKPDIVDTRSSEGSKDGVEYNFNLTDSGAATLSAKVGVDAAPKPASANLEKPNNTPLTVLNTTDATVAAAPSATELDVNLTSSTSVTPQNAITGPATSGTLLETSERSTNANVVVDSTFANVTSPTVEDLNQSPVNQGDDSPTVANQTGELNQLLKINNNTDTQNSSKDNSTGMSLPEVVPELSGLNQNRNASQNSTSRKSDAEITTVDVVWTLRETLTHQIGFLL